MHERKTRPRPGPIGQPLPSGGGTAPVAGPFPEFITAQADGVTLAIKLQPRASKNEIGDPSGPELRIRVTAPPVESAANEALLRLLADTLDCSRGHVVLIRGQSSRHKVVRIFGTTPAAIRAKLGT